MSIQMPGGITFGPNDLKALLQAEGNFELDLRNGVLRWTDGPVGSDSASGADEDDAAGEVDEGDVELAGQLIGMAGEAESPEEKATLLKAAIELLGGEATQGAGGDDSVPGGDDSASGGAAGPTTFEGDALRDYLSAEGGTVEEGKDGGYAVENGADGVDVIDGEVDRGQSLTFTVPPEQAENGGGEVTLGKLFRNGPDNDHVEQAKVTFYDENGKVVDEQVVQGTPDGEATASTDKPFASVEVTPLDDGAGASPDNSDFVLKSVTVNPAEAGGAEETGEPDDAGGEDETGGAEETSGPTSTERPDNDDTDEQTQLLNLLGQLVQLIEQNVQDPEMKGKLLDIVGKLMESLLGSGAIQPTQMAAE